MKYSVMCVGDDPMGIMEKYDMYLTTDTHIKYYFRDSGKYRESAILATEKILENKDKFKDAPGDYIGIMTARLDRLKNMSDLDYYLELTYGMDYDKDYNAITDENDEGMWETIRKLNDGDTSFYPLKLKDGKETFSAVNKDIDWKATNMPEDKVELYNLTWDIIVEGKKPTNEREEELLKAMSGKTGYLIRLHTKDRFVKYSTSYSCIAFVDENGWHDSGTDFAGDHTEWTINFYDRFIKNLPPDAKITIFECTI